MWPASVAAIAGLDEVAEVQTLLLEPTVRPTVDEPRSRAGLYVFRFFDVAHKDVDEIAGLSAQAWKDFETGGDYAAIPQGLFRESRAEESAAPRGKMLLCTWYDGLNSWQASRTPPGEAGALFRRRHTLTQGTIAYATRLLVLRASTLVKLQDEQLALFANDTFYLAFAQKDFRVMERLWAQRHPTLCIHPGWPAITERKQIVHSWQRIMDNPEQPGIDFYNASANSIGPVVMVSCYEELPGAVCIAPMASSRSRARCGCFTTTLGLAPIHRRPSAQRSPRTTDRGASSANHVSGGKNLACLSAKAIGRAAVDGRECSSRGLVARPASIMPASNKSHAGTASMTCVMMSGGVSSMPTTKQPTIT